MTQKAIVKKIIDENMAEIEVQRESACGHDCAKCGGCGAPTERVSAQALNTIGAKPGDTVTIEGDTKLVLGSAALVYLLPIALFFLFYAAAVVVFSAHLPGLTSYAPAFACFGFFIGIGCAILYNHKLKRNNTITYTIVKNH